MNIDSVLDLSIDYLRAGVKLQAKNAELKKPIQLSVIVPVYNAMPYFAECMRSLLNQTFESMEIIIVNDGSTDGSGEFAEIIAENFGNVRVIRQKKAGVSAARNAGIDAARGDYIGFTDADDFVEPDMYEKMLTAASEHSAQVVSARFKCIGSECSSHADAAPLFEAPTLLNRDDMAKLLPEMNTNKVFHFCWRNIFSKALLKSEKIRFNENIFVGEDTLFNMRALLFCRTALMLPDVLYNYRLHNDSCMRSGKYKPFLLKSLSLQYDEKLKLVDKYFFSVKNLYLQKTAEDTLKAKVPFLVKNIYSDATLNQKAELQKIFASDMVKDAFMHFDINSFRSKSLDWLMLRFAKNNRFTLAHLICRRILYKTQ